MKASSRTWIGGLYVWGAVSVLYLVQVNRGCYLIARQAPATPSRRVDNTTVTSLHVDLAPRPNVNPSVAIIFQFLYPVVGTTLPGLSTVHSERPVDPPLRDDAEGQRVAALPVAHHTTATIEPALAAAALADGELAQQHGVALFDDLDVRGPRVGHVDLHTRGAMPGRPRALTTADSLAVTKSEPTAIIKLIGCGFFSTWLKAVAEEAEAVHASLGGGCGLEGFEQEVHESL